MAKLMQFDYDIKYKRDAENTVVDALSRILEKIVLALTPFIIPINTAPLVPEMHNCKLSSWRSKLTRHPTPIIHGQKVNTGAKESSLWGKTSHCATSYWIYFIPQPLGGHSVVLPTYKRMSTVVYWPGMTKAVREYIRNYSICQRLKVTPSAPAGLLQPLPISSSLFSDLTMDFIEALPRSNGKSAIFVIVYRLQPFHRHVIHDDYHIRCFGVPQ